MIHPHSHTLDWIEEVSAKIGIADKTLLEKAIRALSLLEGLVSENLDFVFKGGTALMLLLGSNRRLSIDIDIIMPEVPHAFEAILRRVASTANFVGFELQERQHQSGIQKAHYKFWYYPSHRTNQKQDYILLDIVFEEIKYNAVVAHPIDCPFIKHNGNPLLVAVPTIENILGDKLTAFAPATTGIPYFKNGNSKSMEIIKQLFDIGCLFEQTHAIQPVAASFFKFAQSELLYRGLTALEPRHVLADIFETAYCISVKGVHERTNFDQLHLGIRRIQSFIFSEKYHIEKAIVHAAKAAYLSKLILNGIAVADRWNPNNSMKDLLIVDVERNRLNKLKKSNPEAFFYWHLAMSLDDKVAIGSVLVA